MMIPQNSIAVFGGSFNPIHNGHIALVNKILEFKFFTNFFAVPNKIEPLSHRLKMLELAFQNELNVQISRFEVDSLKPSYSIFTLEYFKQEYSKNEIFFILGEDSFHSLPQWYQFPKILEMSSFLVIHRRGWKKQLPNDLLKYLIESPSELPFYKRYKTNFQHCIALDLHSNLSHSRPGNAPATNPPEVYFLDLNLPDVSSTKIKECLHTKQPITGFVPEAIEQYLITYDPYGTEN